MKSLWRETSGDDLFGRPFPGEVRTDVLIIGGGLSGLLTAWLLREAGVDCVVAEGGRVGQGVTGNTTAKVTAQHGLAYNGLIRRFGREAARQYYDVNAAAVAAIRDLSGRFPCDFETKNAHIYSTSGLRHLEEEAEAYARLGIPGEMVSEVPIPVRHAGALRMPDQGQIHPLKLLHGLARDLTVFEDTFVRQVRNGVATVRAGGSGALGRGEADAGVIRAGHIVLCTHYPLVNVPGLYVLKLTQERSYVMAVEDGPDVDGMYLDGAGGYSFRNYGRYLLIGGGNHATGKKGAGYRAPQDLARREFPGKPLPYAWAAQDCMSLDHVPYAGRFRDGDDSLLLASGFNKWGMSGSMAAAMTIRDLLTRGTSDWEDLFRPARSMLRPRLASNLISAMAGMIGLHKRCPHLGCALRRNEQENSWDCPCHGSRFDALDGRVLDNPAKKGLRLG